MKLESSEEYLAALQMYEWFMDLAQEIGELPLQMVAWLNVCHDAIVSFEREKTAEPKNNV